jgi:LmbE family N-acetylglucosaminyl deacetylase
MFSPVFFAALSLIAILSPARAQKNLAGETAIRDRLDRLSTLGSVMMIAAHPDDENTALLAYFARGRHMRTAYLSLTRGEGGQNLIGSEQGDELGIIRTQELLAARRIDGGEQFFTRAIDFGFSKTADDTFAHWPREKVLGDIVWNIRRFRPDVIVLQFSGTPRDGHGQHQVSAILGREAFSAAADPAKYPEQLQLGIQPWQAKRLMQNLPAFTADMEKEARAAADRVEVDVGEYNPVLGYSYGEIAGMSRSQHRSQAMGAPERKGSTKAYLVTIAGDKATTDPFDGIDTSWGRQPGGAAVGALVEEARKSFAPDHPDQILKSLAQARPLIKGIADATKDPTPEHKLAELKLKDLDETVADCATLWLDASADKAQVSPGGSSLKIRSTALVRLPVPVTLVQIFVTTTSGGGSIGSSLIQPTVLVPNQPLQYSTTSSFLENHPYSQPYWLVEPKDGWLYSVPNPRQIGDPENPPELKAGFNLKVAGVDVWLTRPVQYRYLDHIYGEMTRPLAVVPPVAVDANMLPLVFPTAKSRTVEVPIKSNTGKVAGDVQLDVPAGWRVEPALRHFELTAAGHQTTAIFEITPDTASLDNAQGELRATATVGDRKISLATEVINYPHIPTQTLFPAATTKLVRADIRTLAHNIGYIVGAGDEEPEAIRQMGATVTLLSPSNLTAGGLSQFDAIVTGVRAWSVRSDLRANYQRLFDYVRDGGTLIVQYDVPEVGPFGADPSLLEHIGPLPITLSRDRVTESNAPVAFPNPRNSLLHAPNTITPRDFDGWVQERGLNFASEWDPKYQSILESHDQGEEPHPGGELYLRLGKGVYIFSAYSWFRELPAGVAGAYRLFANMLSAGKVP